MIRSLAITSLALAVSGAVVIVGTVANVALMVADQWTERRREIETLNLLGSPQEWNR